MKAYTVSIDINRPRDEVIELFDSSDNLFCWQTGLQSYEHLSGEPGTVGAQAMLVYQDGKHRVELTETITKIDLPDAFNGTYEWGGGMNTLENRFIEVDANTTRWESTCQYHMKTLFMKFMGFFMAGMFKKQNMAFLKNFKAFCETGHDVRVNGPVN